MSVATGRSQFGVLQERIKSSMLNPSKARCPFSTSAIRHSADPSPLETTSSVQQSQTSEQSFRNTSASGSTSQRRGDGPLPEYAEWRKKQAKAFQDTPRGQGPFWLGQTPFPLNPSFQPPAPVAHSVRDTMWKLHKADSKRNSIRALSGRFSVPMERTVAILRLMALEDEFKKEVSSSVVQLAETCKG